MTSALFIPELGQLAMILALCFAIVQAVVPLLGAWRGDRLWMSLAQPAAWGQFAFLLFAFGCLTYAFMTDDFSVAYVANNSNSALPWYFKFSAVWGAHEGSLLLWALILGGWTFAVSVFSRQLPQVMLARVLAVMGMISIGFLLFLIMTSNPFSRILPQIPADGHDLNPLLQDIGLIVHPPMLYMGYVGFSVAFAFAIAALLGGVSMRPGRAGRGRGPSSPGRSSALVSRWARGGPTTNSAGAAGGSGTRWKTPRSCPGWSALR